MRRTLASLILVIALVGIPIYMSGHTAGGAGTQPGAQPMTGSATDPQSLGSARTYGDLNRSSGFDFGWLGLLGLVGLLGLRRTHRGDTVTR